MCICVCMESIFFIEYARFNSKITSTVFLPILPLTFVDFFSMEYPSQSLYKCVLIFFFFFFFACHFAINSFGDGSSWGRKSLVKMRCLREFISSRNQKTRTKIERIKDEIRRHKASVLPNQPPSPTNTNKLIVQSARAVEYTDCISAEG